MTKYKIFLFSCFTFFALSGFSITSNWKKIEELTDKAKALLNTNLDSANLYVDSAFQLVEAPLDTMLLKSLYNTKANIIYQQGNYKEAVSYYLKALKLFDGNQNLSKSETRARAAILKNIAAVYYFIDNFDLALDYLAKAEKERLKLNSTPADFVGIYNIRGLIFYEKDQYDSALYSFSKGLSFLKNDTTKSNTKGHEVNFTNNMGLVYSDLNRPEKAIAYYLKGLRYYEEKKEYVNLTWSYIHLANEYIKLKQRDESRHYLQMADKTAQISSSLESQKDIAYAYLQFYIQFDQKEAISKSLDDYLSIRDSIVDLKIEKNTQEIEAKYQVEKHAADLALSKENSSRLSAENKAQRLFLIVAIGLVVLLCLIFFFSYRAYQQRKKIDRIELKIKDTKLDELMSNYESAAFAAMLEGQEKERNRIAQDLHDRLGGTLAALKLALRRPENKVSPDDLSIVDEAVGEVRAIAHNLSSGLLEKYGLNEALQQLFQSIERSGGMKFKMYLHPAVSKLGQNVALEFYRMVQEMVSNTIKHANATEINLQTNMTDTTFNLIFEDNGKGFDPNKVEDGLGLINLKKRAEKIGADLNIDSKIGRGTIVIIDLNLKK